MRLVDIPTNALHVIFHPKAYSAPFGLSLLLLRLQFLLRIIKKNYVVV